MTDIDDKTVAWASAVEIERQKPGFLLSHFMETVYFYSDEVSYDVGETQETPAAPVAQGSPGPRLNRFDTFTNIKYVPPFYREGVKYNRKDGKQRALGEDPITAAQRGGVQRILSRMMADSGRLATKIQRALEVQASQIFQTGALDIKVPDGASGYQVDFQSNDDNFFTVSTLWSDASATPIDDLLQGADSVDSTGKIPVQRMVMNGATFQHFVRNDSVSKVFDNRNMNLGELDPVFEGTGASKQGFVAASGHRLDVWTYDEKYMDVETSALVKYIPDGKVCLLPDPRRARMRRLHSQIELLRPPDPRLAPYLPSRISGPGVEFTPNAYFSEDGHGLTFELESGVLLAPGNVNSFACLTVL